MRLCIFIRSSPFISSYFWFDSYFNLYFSCLTMLNSSLSESEFALSPYHNPSYLPASLFLMSFWHLHPSWNLPFCHCRADSLTNLDLLHLSSSLLTSHPCHHFHFVDLFLNIHVWHGVLAVINYTNKDMRVQLPSFASMWGCTSNQIINPASAWCVCVYLRSFN